MFVVISGLPGPDASDRGLARLHPRRSYLQLDNPVTSSVLILFLSSGTAGVTNTTVGLGTVRLWF